MLPQVSMARVPWGGQRHGGGVPQGPRGRNKTPGLREGVPNNILTAVERCRLPETWKVMPHLQEVNEPPPLHQKAPAEAGPLS